MTKAECIIENYGFQRAQSQDYPKKKHDGSSYVIRVWEAVINGVKWSIECDSYYGSSIVFEGEIRLGDFECKYEMIPTLFGEKRYSH